MLSAKIRDENLKNGNGKRDIVKKMINGRILNMASVLICLQIFQK